MLNRVVLIGRMTRDPELRKTTSGMPVLSFRIAVDDSRKGPNGEKQTLFMGCSMFGNRAENVARFTHKGSLVAVEGRLQQRKYTDRNGNEVNTIDTICDNVEFLDPKGSAPQDSGYQSDTRPAGGFSQAPERNNAPSGGNSSSSDAIDVLDDDLPF